MELVLLLPLAQQSKAIDQSGIIASDGTKVGRTKVLPLPSYRYSYLFTMSIRPCSGGFNGRSLRNTFACARGELFFWRVIFPSGGLDRN